MSLCNRFDFGTSKHPGMFYLSNHSAAKLTLNMRRNFRQPKHRRVRVRSPPSWIWIRDDKLTLVKSGCAKMFLLSHIVVFDLKHIYLDILIDQRFSRSQMIIEFASEVSNLASRVSQSQNGGTIFTLTKWSPMFGSVVFDHQWYILIVMSVKCSFNNEYDIKNNENMCCGLSVVFKITTRRSTIDVRKKSDLSRKNRTTGSPGHVRKISDQPRPGNGDLTI